LNPSPLVPPVGSLAPPLTGEGKGRGRPPEALTVRACARRAPGRLDIIGITSTPLKSAMADIVLRNLDDELKERLRQSASRHRRSMNAELREIVRQALNGPQRGSAADFQKLAAEIRALSHGRRQTPSEELLRESRDER
jgi:plasmid stability protein